MQLAGDATSHDSDAVDGIHQGFRIFLEYIAGFVFDHSSILPDIQ